MWGSLFIFVCPKVQSLHHSKMLFNSTLCREICRAMERRSWPWRRKSSEKTMSVLSYQHAFSASHQAVSLQHASPTQSTIPHNRSSMKQDKLSTEKTRSCVEEDRVLEAVVQQQQAEEKVAILTEKLARTMSELAEKKEMINQHEKVSKEAAAGWEQAKGEIKSLKHQLETCFQQKSAAESQVSHLDEAFKECVRQVRHLKEERDQKTQETVMKKSQEWDSIRAELEAKQADLARQVLEAEAECSAMAKSLQERAKTIIELTDAKAKAEAEVKVLHVRVESSEKDISSLKYEIHVLSKELEIRNDEIEYSMKSANSAHRQHLENVKKIAKLDSECQRLRALVHKKLQSPAALAQLKKEVDVFGRDLWEGKKRRPVSKSRSVPLTACQEHPVQVSATSKEVQLLTERLLAMDEEINLLKEALEKRNQDVQAARQMCARVASKLTSVRASPKVIGNKDDLQIDGLFADEPSFVSRSEDGCANDDEVSCAESWASALIAELAHFKKNKHLSSSRQSLESCSFGNIDDTMESVVFEDVEDHPILDIQSLYHISKILSSKLLIAEENLNSLKVANAEVSASKLQESYDWVHEAQEGVSRLNKMLHDLAATASINSTIKVQADTPRSCFSECTSDALFGGNHTLQDPTEPMNSHAKDSISTNRAPSVSYLMCKIIQLIESLASIVIQHVKVEAAVDSTLDENHSRIKLSTDFEKKMQSLISVKGKLCHAAKLDINEYLLKVALVLSSLLGIDAYEIENALANLGSSSSTGEEVEKLVVGCSNQYGDLETRTNEDNPNLEVEEIDLKKRSDHPKLECDTIVENLQRDLENIKQDKVAVENKLGAAEEEVRNIKSKLVEKEVLVSELQEKIALIQETKEKVEGDLADINSSRNDLAVQLQDAKAEISLLSSKVTLLVEELEDKQRQYMDTLAKCEELEEQLKVFMKRSNSEVTTENEVSRQDDEWYRKGQEVAAAKYKLAECQRAILALGKQLNALTNVSDSADGSFLSSVDSGFVVENRTAPMVLHNEEDIHINNAREEMERLTAAQSSLICPRSNKGLLDNRNNSRRPQGHIYYHPQSQLNNTHMMHHHEFAPKGSGLHTPMEECSERSSMFLHCSPSDTAVSSAANSPAKLMHYNQKRSCGNGVRMSLTKSMNKAASSNDTKPLKSSSSLGRLFSRNKHHH